MNIWLIYHGKLLDFAGMNAMEQITYKMNIEMNEEIPHIIDAHPNHGKSKLMEN